MILVDTSVLIDYFRGADNKKTRLFDSVVAKDLPFGISLYTYQELLAGARDEKEWRSLKDYLSTIPVWSLQATRETHENAARMFFDLRRVGVTVRSSIDILIAQTALAHELFLLHNDRDFDQIADALTELKILTQI